MLAEAQAAQWEPDHTMLCCHECSCVVLQAMQAAKASPGILKTCASQKLLDQLNECNKLLESVQKVSLHWRDCRHTCNCMLAAGPSGMHWQCCRSRVISHSSLLCSEDEPEPSACS